jgi:hypothetical protein
MTVKTKLKGGKIALNRNTTATLKVARQLEGGRLANHHDASVR